MFWNKIPLRRAEEPQAMKEVMEIQPKKSKVHEIIEEIHNRFEGAADKLLAEAEGIISNTTIDEVAIRKERLGFKKAKGVAENNQAQVDIARSEVVRKTILYFKTAYPQYKFITEDEVKVICEKYGLVFGPSGKYKGDIPIKNIEEIEKFSAFKKHIKPADHKYIEQYFGFQMTEKEISYEDYQRHQDYKRDLAAYHRLSSSSVYRQVDGFSICAPLADMDTDRMVLKGHKLVPIPDPVVLFPVRNGYLIVSKWGLPEDNLMTNERNN